MKQIQLAFCFSSIADRWRDFRGNMTHLVEVLEQVDYPTLGLALAKTGRGRVEADTLSEAGSELGDLGSNGGAADVEGSRSPDDTGGGSLQGTNNGGAEHDEVD